MLNTTYRSPGVFYETVDTNSSTRQGIRTDIAGFVGIAERGPIDIAVVVESWRQFEACFGGFNDHAYLAFSVRAFFENGGRRCRVVRVASKDSVAGARAASAVLKSATADTASWIVRASSAGSWGDTLSVRCIMHNRVRCNATVDATDRRIIVASNTTGIQRGTLLRISSSDSGLTGRTCLGVVSEINYSTGKILLSGIYQAVLSPASIGLPTLFGREISIESIEYTLSVFERGNVVGVYEGLSLIPEHPKYGPKVLPSTAVNLNRIEIAENRIRFLERNFGGILESDLIANSDVSLAGGLDGLSALDVEDFIGFDTSPEQSDYVKTLGDRGARVLCAASDVSLVAMPDLHRFPVIRNTEFIVKEQKDPCLCECSCSCSSFEDAAFVEKQKEIPRTFSLDEIYRAQAELVSLCEREGDKFAILDSPFIASGETVSTASLIQDWRARFNSHTGALYFPWCTVVDPMRVQNGGLRSVPPSGHVAGQIAKMDSKTGPHRSPANEPLAWVQAPSYEVDDALLGDLNSQSINVIASVTGRAIRIMGARTLSHDYSWRYISVRRLTLMIKRALRVATQWAAFEPNNSVTRTKLQMAAANYMGAIWQNGALAGSSIEQSFFVKCDEENNPDFERANGRLNLDIGFAPTTPLEFIVLRVRRANNELEISDAGGGLAELAYRGM